MNRLKCWRMRRLLCDEASGELAAGDRARLERHTGQCRRCKRILGDMSAVDGLLAEYGEVPPPPGAASGNWPEISRALRTFPRVEPSGGKLVRLLVPSLAGAALALVLAWGGGRIAALRQYEHLLAQVEQLEEGLDEGGEEGVPAAFDSPAALAETGSEHAGSITLGVFDMDEVLSDALSDPFF